MGSSTASSSGTVTRSSLAILETSVSKKEKKKERKNE